MATNPSWLAAIAITALVSLSAMAASCEDGPAGSATPPAAPTYTTQVVGAPIDELEILTLESFPPQYSLRIVSGLPSGCALFDNAEETGRTGNTITVRVTNTLPEDPEIACTAIYGMKETTLSLGSDFTSGQTYTVNVNDKSIDFTAQ